VAAAIAATAIACVRAGAPVLGRALVVGALAIGPFAFGDGARLARATEAPEIDEIVARLHEREDWRGRPVYTNAPLLPLVLERDDAPRVGAVHYLVQADQLHELTRLSNPDNGQRAALLTLVRKGFGCPALLPGDVKPEDVAGALFVLVDDPRLSLVLSNERWEPWLETVYASERVRIATVRTEAAP
jgi:hypothetical protein